MSSTNRYGLALTLFAFLFLSLIAGFNWIVDPYQMMGSPKIEGLNTHKTSIFFHLEKTKTYQFLSNDTDSLILGSSRAGQAIDPGHPSLAANKYYNFATPGSRPLKDYLKLHGAVHSRKIIKLIYFVDFFSFNRHAPPRRESSNALRKRLPGGNSLNQRASFNQQKLSDFGSGLWAYSTFRDSKQMLNQQQAAKTGQISYKILENNGFWRSLYQKSRSPLTAFVWTENTYLASNWFNSETRRFSISKNELAPLTPFADFEKLLALAQSKNIETTIVVLPIHTRLLENLAYAGLWRYFELWKKELVSLNEKVAEEHGSKPFIFWDFNGYYSINSEVIGENATSLDLKWFYDSSHAHINTGNRILDIIAGRMKADFGGKISSKNIDEWLKKQRQLREQYRLKNPETSSEIRLNVEKARSKNPWTISPLKPDA